MSRESIVFARCSRTLIVLLSRKNQKSWQHHQHQLCWEQGLGIPFPKPKQIQWFKRIPLTLSGGTWGELVNLRKTPGADWSHRSGTGTTDLCRALVGLWIYVMYMWYYIYIIYNIYIYLHTMIYMVCPRTFINVLYIYIYIITFVRWFLNWYCFEMFFLQSSTIVTCQSPTRTTSGSFY